MYKKISGFSNSKGCLVTSNVCIGHLTLLSITFLLKILSIECNLCCSQLIGEKNGIKTNFCDYFVDVNYQNKRASMDSSYSDGAPYYKIVENCYRELNRGRGFRTNSMKVVAENIDVVRELIV